MLFDNIRISKKYPLIIVALALFAALVTGLVAYNQSSEQMRVEAEGKLVALLESRKAALDSYFTTIREDLRFQAASPLVIDALREFRWAWKQLGGESTETLQRLYITDNPYPTGDKESLDTALDGSDYSVTHKQYHPAFREFLRERGYYDIFLFDPDGNLVYTVFKELDFATNLITGQWRDTDLGKAFRAARDNPKPGFQALFDFRPYEPSYGTPASFISTPVFDEVETFIGVLAFQMPISRLNDVMQVTAGMGKTGETYVVGRDLLMRSDSRFSEESTILKTKVDTATVRKALEGKTGIKVTLDYRGVPVLSAYGPEEVLGVRWAIMAEIDQAEIMVPVHRMRNFMLIVGVVIAVVITAIGVFFALDLSRPIVAMTEVMGRLATRDLKVEIPSPDRRDEIGEMAKALLVFKENVVKRMQAETRLRKSEKRLKQLAATDPLTGANNRRSFLDKGEKELRRSHRYNRPFSVLMMDIDHFKRINDTEGHAIGDEVLKQLVSKCLETLREQDIFGRLGGEEFAVVLPEVNLAAAMEAAERLRQALEDMEVETSKGTLKFTVSIGISEYRSQKEPLKAALDRADKALYAAKKAGRNRVIAESA